MPSAKPSQCFDGEIQIGPLADVVELQIHRLPGLSVATDERKRRAFFRSLEALADGYADRRKRVDQALGAEMRFRAVASAAEALRLAIDALSKEDMEALGTEQRQAFEAQRAELDESELSALLCEYDCSDEPYAPRTAADMRKWQDFAWLERGAKRQMPRRERGRPINVAEHWAAERFLILCHNHGWSPVTLSNSGIERKAGIQSVPSPAVVCLAAVFRAAGVQTGREIVRATSALKSLRGSHTHYIDQPFPADEIYEVEPDHYEVSLKRVKYLGLNGSDALPNFIPKEK